MDRATGIGPPGGSQVDMAWTREFKSDPHGAFFAFLFGRLGERLFGKYARDVIENLDRPRESWQPPAPGTSFPRWPSMKLWPIAFAKSSLPVRS
jgi:hypothetical protein